MFIRDEDHLPEGYIKFHQVSTKFDRLPIGQGLVTCIFDDQTRRLHILEDSEIVGFFYNSFKFTTGIAEAATDDARAYVATRLEAEQALLKAIDRPVYQ